MLQTELWSMHVIVAMLASGSSCKEANLCKILKCQKLKADDLTKMLGGRSGMFILQYYLYLVFIYARIFPVET